jgi:3-oxoacid CoA-transferase subunit A
VVLSPAKETRRFDVLGRDREYVLETALRCDVAFVRAAVADRSGNCLFERSARNFNPLAARSARTTIVEVDELVEAGDLDPDAVHLPGIHVDRIVVHTTKEAGELPIELLTTRPRTRHDS